MRSCRSRLEESHGQLWLELWSTSRLDGATTSHGRGPGESSCREILVSPGQGSATGELSRTYSGPLHICYSPSFRRWTSCCTLLGRREMGPGDDGGAISSHLSHEICVSLNEMRSSRSSDRFVQRLLNHRALYKSASTATVKTNIIMYSHGVEVADLKALPLTNTAVP